MNRSVVPLILLVAVLAGGAYWFWSKNDPPKNALRVREIATRGLAEYLAKRWPGQRLLVVSNPFTQHPGVARSIVEMEEAGLRGLREGCDNRLVLETVAFPELREDALKNPRALVMGTETTTPLSYLVAEDAFDKLVKANPRCELLVSLIGLPEDLDQTQCWQSNAPPRFALLLPDLRMIGDASAVREAMKRGKLAAFVLDKPGAPSAQSPPGRDAAAEFEKRFVLVTADNIDPLIQNSPQLFPRN
jgi:hypothetical protein